MTGEHRDHILEMAATWENLANERAKLLRRHPELAIDGEHGEEAAQRVAGTPLHGQPT